MTLDILLSDPNGMTENSYRQHQWRTGWRPVAGCNKISWHRCSCIGIGCEIRQLKLAVSLAAISLALSAINLYYAKSNLQ